MFDFIGDVLGGIGGFAKDAFSGITGAIGDFGGYIGNALGGLDLDNILGNIGGLAKGVGGIMGLGGRQGIMPGEQAGTPTSPAPSGQYGLPQYGIPDLGLALYDLYRSSQQRKELESVQKKATQIADPYAQYRPQAAKRLNALVSNPGSITESPSYQFRFDEGVDALNRGLAASGLRGSGNRMRALMELGQGMASQEYEAEFDRLNRLSTGSPSTAEISSNLALQRLLGYGTPTQATALGRIADILGGRTSQENDMYRMLQQILSGI